MKKKALITGITGQDGSYLSELLLGKNYQVHGVVRPISSGNFSRIAHLQLHIVTDKEDDFPEDEEKLFLHHGDLSDAGSINKILSKVRPDEIYHLGAVSNVQTSFEIPEYTSHVTALATLRILDALRDLKLLNTKFYQASSSEMFGKVESSPQNELTPFHPVSPYGTSKVFAYWISENYRRAYGMFVCNGILFNHESPRRGLNFVTRKITSGIAAIMAGKQEKLLLGNLEAKRDWGYSPEYVDAMWRMMQQKQPEDFVIATGETHSVAEFVEEAFGLVKLDWKKYVETDRRYVRPLEVDYLLGDFSKAKAQLGWQPRVTFKQLVKIMLEADLERVGLSVPDQPTRLSGLQVQRLNYF